MRLAFWRKMKRDQRRLSVDYILERLSLIRARLSRRIKEMEARHKEMFEQVVKAHMEKDKEKTAMYAEELAELRKTLRRLTHASLLLEGVVYRIEAVKDLNDASRIVLPLKDILTIASQEVRGIAPAASDGLSELVEIMEDLSINAGRISEPIDVGSQLSEEARKILEEASSIAAQRRSNRSFE